MKPACASVQRWMGNWKQSAERASTIIVVLTVAVVVLTLIRSEVIAAWKGPGTAEQSFVSNGIFEGLFSFEGPSVTVARFQAESQEAKKSMEDRSSMAFLLVKRWNYTQTDEPPSTFDSTIGTSQTNPSEDAAFLRLGQNLQLEMLSYQLLLYATALQNFQSAISTFGSLVTQAGGANPSLAPFITNLNSILNSLNSIITSYINLAAAVQSIVNGAVPPSYRSPPILPASPSR